MEDDPLWLGVCCLAGLSVVSAIVLHLQLHTGPSEADGLFFLPLMAVGYARKVRDGGGNVTERARQVLAGTTAQRRYSRSFAAWLLGVYGLSVFVAVASWGPTAGVLGYTVVQGAFTAQVVVRAA